MTTQIPLGLALRLSKYVHELGKQMNVVRTLNLAAVCSQSPEDAKLVAHELRSLMRQAEAAALTFEEVAKETRQ